MPLAQSRLVGFNVLLKPRTFAVSSVYFFGFVFVHTYIYILVGYSDNNIYKNSYKYTNKCTNVYM